MTLRRDLTLLTLILVLCLLPGAAVNHLDAEAAGPGIRGGPAWDKPWVVLTEARELPERVELVSLGEFVATAYCSCPKCCGVNNSIYELIEKAAPGGKDTKDGGLGKHSMERIAQEAGTCQCK